MYDILFWAALYLLTAALGYCLKRRGVFRAGDRVFLSNLILCVTLPAMIVSSFEGITADLWFAAAFFLDVALNILMLAAAFLASRQKSPELQALYIVNCTGLNLGNLAIPFLGNFLPSGIPYLCMCDAGDSLFSLGTTFAIANRRLGRSSGSPLRSVFQSLSRSVPFLTYLAMTAFSLLQIQLPRRILEAAEFAGSGNGFLAMLLVGVSLEPALSRSALRETARMLLVRYACAATFAAAILLVLPLPPVMRQVLAPAAFAAVPNAALIYSHRLGINADIASALNPISTVLMLPLMAVTMLLTA